MTDRLRSCVRRLHGCLGIAIALAAPAAPAHAEPGDRRIVRRIIVDTRPLFDPEEDELFGSAPYSWLNELKIPTYDWILRREVLIQPGEELDLRLVRESERNIRSLGFVRTVQIEVRPVDDERVDLYVRAQETWTFQPRLSGSFGGGEQNATVGLTEQNLFGLGTQLSVSYTADVERDALSFAYRDPRVLGSRYSTTLNYAQLSDGDLRAISVARPFFAFDTRFSYGIGLLDQTRRDNLYELGDEIREWEHDVGAVRSFVGMRVSDPGPVVHRVSLSHSYTDDDFTEVERDPATPLPEDRRFSLLGLRWTRIEDRYVVRRRIESFERQEDFNVGQDYALSIGYSPVLLGSADDALFLGGAWHDGFATPSWLGLADLALSGRLRDGSFENVVGRWSFQGYYTGLPIQTLAFSWSGLASVRRNPEDRFVVGGLDELRGYPDRWVNGAGGMVGHIEDRIFLVDRVLGILSFGVAAFYDVAASIDEQPGFSVGKLYHSIGAGLRIGLPVSSVGRVIRIDVAWALNDTGDDSRVGLSITTGQVFRPFESFL